MPFVHAVTFSCGSCEQKVDMYDAFEYEGELVFSAKCTSCGRETNFTATEILASIAAYKAQHPETLEDMDTGDVVH